MKLKFWGAARTVTGSQHLLELENGKKILLDCGLYQGREFFAEEYNTTFACPPAEVDYLILSHAHIDHCGNIPHFVKDGFKGPVYCTHATYDLCTIMLADSAKIQESEARRENKYRARRGQELIEPLYRGEDVVRALSHFHSHPYDRWVHIGDGIELLFRDAGHMLGSASVTLRFKEGGKTITFGFTGDIGRPNRKILRDPQPMPECDYLISESTYGGKDHADIPAVEEHLLEVIRETCVKNRGKVIIPAFSVGRTQDIVHCLDRLENAGELPRIPIYVDSPLAVNATDIYRIHPECYDEKLIDYMQNDPNPFGWNRLHYIRRVEDSKRINEMKGPMVIISASGMMTAGRILHHLRNNIEDPKTTVLVVGYCAQHTLGARLVDGADEVKIHGEEYKVKAKIMRLNGLSAHGGQTEMFQFLENQKKSAKKVFLVHGEANRSDLFKEYLDAHGFREVIIPERGENFILN